MVQNANSDFFLQINNQHSLYLPLAVQHPSVMRTLLETNAEWINWHLENCLLQLIYVMVRCLICTLNATADLYSLGLIKRSTRMKIRVSRLFIFLPSACEIKREEESKRKKGQEANGQCPARTILLS